MSQIHQIEHNVLGAILHNNSFLNEINLVPDNFVLQSHREIFSAMREMKSAKTPIDLTTLSHYIKQKHQFDCQSKLIEMMRYVPSSKNVKVYADSVWKAWRSRQAMAIAQSLMDIGKSDNQDMIDTAIQDLMALNKTSQDHDHDIRAIMQKTVADIEKAKNSKGSPMGITTGLTQIDNVLGGMHKTDLIVIGARPAMGKTALLLNILTSSENSSPGICSSEQGASQIGSRLISIKGDVNSARIRRGMLNDDEWQKAFNTSKYLLSRNINVNDKPNMTITDIERQARFWVHEKGVNVIGVDYIQKIKHENKNLTNVDRVADVAERLKELAKELDVPVVALAQVNRGVEQRQDKRPTMSDIKDCGVVEQEADQVMTIYRDEVYNENTDRKGLADITICKNRHGGIGSVVTKWVASYMQFRNLDGVA
jgi:replicative DNA helicase